MRYLSAKPTTRRIGLVIGLVILGLLLACTRADNPIILLGLYAAGAFLAPFLGCIFFPSKLAVALLGPTFVVIAVLCQYFGDPDGLNLFPLAAHISIAYTCPFWFVGALLAGAMLKPLLETTGEQSTGNDLE